MDSNEANAVRVATLYENVLWMHKTLEKQADVYAERGFCWKVASIFFVALTGSGIFTSFLSDIYWIKVGSLVAAALALFVTIFREAQAYEEKGFDCVRAANGFLLLRNDVAKCKLLIGSRDDCDLLDQLEREYACLCGAAPRTSNKAVELAKKAKEDGEFVMVGEDE